MYQTKAVGNERVRHILTGYIDNIHKTGDIPVPFLLLMWPSWLGKMSVAIEAAKILLGGYFHQDSLILEDQTVLLEKPHTIKISSDEELTRADGSIYVDLGIREVHQRMVKSPAGSRKILIIEDIERMTESAANALLKILEEPLPGRLIIATTSQSWGVLPTILSRALLFSFYPTSDDGIDTYIVEHPDLQSYDRNFLYAIATGRPWVLDTLIQNSDQLTILEAAFKSILLATWTDTLTIPTMSTLYANLVPIVKAGLEKTFLQAYIYYAAKTNDRHRVTLAQEAYALCDVAINTEHVFFDFVSRLYVTSWA